MPLSEHAHISVACRKAGKALRAMQQKDGSFSSICVQESGENPEMHRTTFFTSLLLSSICQSSIHRTGNTLKMLAQRAASLLESQRNIQGSYNYWARNSREYSSSPLPDDLDDTCCALSALLRYNPKVVTPKVLASMVKLLRVSQVHDGGPYFTWIVSAAKRTQWKDVDIAVNANVACFLKLNGVVLPPLERFVERKIAARSFSSPYYESEYPVMYFLSQTASGTRAQVIAEEIVRRRSAEGIWGNPLHTALAMCSLLNCGSQSAGELQPAIRFLLSQQEPDGGWKEYPFGVEKIENKKKYYSSCRALTTALCLEALERYRHGMHVTGSDSAQRGSSYMQEKKIMEHIAERARARCNQFDPGLQKQSLEIVEKTLARRDSREIVLLPYLFASGLSGARAGSDLFVTLGLANLYGWIAYGIYDDILDSDGGVSYLPCANAMMREVVRIYSEVFNKSPSGFILVRQVLDGIDDANTWEQVFCLMQKDEKTGEWKVPWHLPQYKDFSVLARRSLGHALGPIAILILQGYKPRSKKVKALMQWFSHYLIVRQLNDDAHDWKQDLRQGRITSVAGIILSCPGAASIVGKHRRLLSSEALRELELHFWRHEIAKVRSRILSHARAARRAAVSEPLFKTHPLLDQLLAPLVAAADRAVEESRKTEDFLQAYHARKS